jgi:hypothetical protein
MSALFVMSTFIQKENTQLLKPTVVRDLECRKNLIGFLKVLVDIETEQKKINNSKVIKPIENK